MSSEDHIEEIKIDEAPDDVLSTDGPMKYDEDNYAKLNRAELDTQVEELDRLGEQQVNSRTWFEKIYLLEYKLHLPDEKYMVYLLGVLASFAGILSGLDQSIISGAEIGMGQQINRQPGEDINQNNISDHEMSLIHSLMPLGAMAGSMLMVPFNHFVGRRGSIIVSCLWYTLGGIMISAAQNVPTLYAARFFIGVGIGIEGGCVGIYISESVPPAVRGSLVSMYQFNIAVGEVIGYSVGAIFFHVYYDIRAGWRFMVGSSLLFSTILLVGMFFLPESPRWLISKGKDGEAWMVWKRLRNAHEPASQIEFLEMRATAAREREVAEQENVWDRYMELFVIPRNRRALIYAVMMIFLGQMTGINGVLYNMSKLMKNVGFNDFKSVCMSIPAAVALMFGTIPAILWMDKFGRRPWAQNICGFFVGLILVGVGSLFIDGEAGVTPNTTTALGLSLTGIYLYMGFFGTYACLTWVLPAESFNLRTRSQGMAICSAFLYLWSFIVTYNFADMTKAMKYIGLMLGFFGGLAFLGFWYQLFFMPETKDRTLEEIDEIFSMPTRHLVALNMRRVKARLSTWGMKSLDDLEGSDKNALRRSRVNANKGSA